MAKVTTIQLDSDPLSRRGGTDGDVIVLAIAWSAEEPHRVGEIAILPEDDHPRTLGRGDEEADLRFFQQRPGTVTAAPPLLGAGLSRRQLLLTASSVGLAVEQAGRCELRVNGATCEKALLVSGDTIHLRRQLVLLCTRRPPLIPALRHFPRDAWRPFGEPDAFGILGESPSTWLLRERLAFAAKAGTHVLVSGESGTGKELAARAIHAMSKRASKPFVARNAATLPAGLIDAELFGNVKNYPNPEDARAPRAHRTGGRRDALPRRDRRAAGGASDAPASRARRGGEYQRLGEGTTRRSSFCLVGATNRDPEFLKHDVLARLTTRVELTPLSARREDVPLLARHLLLRAVEKSPDIASRFVLRDSTGRAFARMTPALVEHLLRRPYATNTRELDAALWRAMAEFDRRHARAPGERARARARDRQSGAAD